MSTRSLISFISFRLASVLTESLADLIKRVFIFACACPQSTLTLPQKNHTAPNTVGVKAFKVTTDGIRSSYLK